MLFSRLLSGCVLVLISLGYVAASPQQEHANETFDAGVIREFHFSQFRAPDTTQTDKALVPKHYLGGEIAVLFYIFKHTYVSESGDYAGTASTPEVQKPAIYYAVIRMNKLLKKSLKSGAYTKEAAEAIMKDCLEKSYALFFENTDALENLMSELTDLEQYVALYRNISFE